LVNNVQSQTQSTEESIAARNERAKRRADNSEEPIDLSSIARDSRAKRRSHLRESAPTTPVSSTIRQVRSINGEESLLSSVTTSTSLGTDAMHFAGLRVGTILFTTHGNIKVNFVAGPNVQVTVLSDKFVYLGNTFEKNEQLSILKSDATLYYDNMECDET
jgi:hypothetical protein